MRGGLHNPIYPTPSAATFFPLFAGFLSRVSGRYYGVIGSGSTTESAVVADQIYASPFPVFVTETFDRIAIRVTVAAVGSARMGIYRDNNLEPGALFLDAGEIDTGTTGDKEIAISATLSPGIWWLAILFSATPSVRTLNSRFGNVLLGIGASSIISGGNSELYYTSYTYGALPDPHPAPTPYATQVPAICLRKA